MRNDAEFSSSSEIGQAIGFRRRMWRSGSPQTATAAAAGGAVTASIDSSSAAVAFGIGIASTRATAVVLFTAAGATAKNNAVSGDGAIAGTAATAGFAGSAITAPYAGEEVASDVSILN